jgi:hypothetical protein
MTSVWVDREFNPDRTLETCERRTTQRAGGPGCKARGERGTYLGRAGAAGLHRRLEFTGDGFLLRRGGPWSALVFLLPAAEIEKPPKA